MKKTIAAILAGALAHDRPDAGGNGPTLQLTAAAQRRATRLITVGCLTPHAEITDAARTLLGLGLHPECC